MTHLAFYIPIKGLTVIPLSLSYDLRIECISYIAVGLKNYSWTFQLSLHDNDCQEQMSVTDFSSNTLC